VRVKKTTLALFLATSVSCSAADFSAWWPWIYSRCLQATNGVQSWVWISANSNTVNYVASHTNLWDQALTNGYLSASNNWAITKVGSRFRLDYDTNALSGGTNAWAWVVANSNLLATTNWTTLNFYPASNPSNYVGPDFGIWGMDSTPALTPLDAVLRIQAGFWAMDSGGHIVLSNYWPDVFWELDAFGSVVPRALP